MAAVFKMWITTLALLTFLKGNFTADVDCNSSPEAQCPRVMPTSFPKNEEEFAKTCDALMSNTQCMLHFAETCGREESEISKTRSVLSYLQKLCQASNPLYEGIVGSLQCLGPIFAPDYGECRKTDDQKAMQFFMYLMDLTAKGVKDATDSAEETTKCLDKLYLDACSAAEVGKKCGPEARNAVVDVLQNLDLDLKICNPKIVDDMIHLVFLFES